VCHDRHCHKGWNGNTADIEAMRAVYTKDAIGEMPGAKSRAAIGVSASDLV